MLVGTKEYGTYKDGSSVYKDSRGFYIVQYNPASQSEYKKHLKGWKHAPTLCMTKRRWKPCKKGTRRSQIRRH